MIFILKRLFFCAEISMCRLVFTAGGCTVLPVFPRVLQNQHIPRLSVCFLPKECHSLALLIATPIILLPKLRSLGVYFLILFLLFLISVTVYLRFW